MKLKSLLIILCIAVSFIPRPVHAAWLSVAGTAYVLGSLGCLGTSSYSSVFRSERAKQQYNERKRMAQDRLEVFMESYPAYKRDFKRSNKKLKDKYERTLKEVKGLLTADEIFDIRFAWETILEDLILMKKDEDDLKNILKKVIELEDQAETTTDMVLRERLVEKIKVLISQSDLLDDRIKFTQERYAFLKVVMEEWKKLPDSEKEEVTHSLKFSNSDFVPLYLEYAFEIGEIKLIELQNGNDNPKLKLFAERYFSIRKLYEIWSELKKNEQSLSDLDKIVVRLKKDIVKTYWGFQYKECYRSLEDWSTDQVDEAFEQIYFTFEGFTEIEGGLSLLDSFRKFFLGLIMLDDEYSNPRFVRLTPVSKDHYCEIAKKRKTPDACLNYEEYQAFNGEIETLNALNDTALSKLMMDVNQKMKLVAPNRRSAVYRELLKSHRMDSTKLYIDAYNQDVISIEAFEAAVKMVSLLNPVKN